VIRSECVSALSEILGSRCPIGAKGFPVGSNGRCRDLAVFEAVESWRVFSKPELRLHGFFHSVLKTVSDQHGFKNKTFDLFSGGSG
jgi:hypothetical protein